MSDAFILAEEKGTEIDEGIFFPQFSLFWTDTEDRLGYFYLKVDIAEISIIRYIFPNPLPLQLPVQKIFLPKFAGLNHLTKFTFFMLQIVGSEIFALSDSSNANNSIDIQVPCKLRA